MKAHRLILQCASFLLLLVVSQKAGAGFFLHNLLHSQDINQPLQTEKQDSGGTSISFACNCIDDFLMPFESSEDITLPAPRILYQKPQPVLVEPVSFRAVTGTHLRGPPSHSV